MLNQNQKNHFLQRLFTFLEVESISADLKSKSEMGRAVSFLRNELARSGFAQSKIETLYARGLSLKTNNPVVYAERLDAPGAPTVLIYGHYDVQPPEPLELWKTPPFKPTIRAVKIYARGATDDKGQLYTHLAALQILSREWGTRWPLNVKILIEGEEENGGKNLEKLIKEKAQKFKADVCLISDSGFKKRGEPAIEIGLRGIAYFELEVKTSKADLHSGLFGGAVYNPLNLLANLLTKIERELVKARLRKEPANAGFTSFDIHGISGGYTGEGSKTVIPSQARAKFSIRLVPGQNSREVVRQVSSFIKKNLPSGVESKLKILGTGEPFAVSGQSQNLKLAQKVMKKVFGKTPVFSRSGGSIPVVATIAEHLEAEVLLIGYGLPDDNLHSPNEKFDLKQFYKGIECNVEFLKQIAK